MVSNVFKIMSLPASTLVYPGHDYRKGNLEFARFADPKNAGLLNVNIHKLIDIKICI